MNSQSNDYDNNNDYNEDEEDEVVSKYDDREQIIDYKQITSSPNTHMSPSPKKQNNELKVYES